MRILHSSRRSAALFLFLVTLLAVACGTLEVGIEPPTTSPLDQTSAREVTIPVSTGTRAAAPIVTPVATPVQSGTPSPARQGNDHSGSPGISADGRYVVFSSGADNLVEGDTNGVADVFAYDRETHTTEIISLADDGSPANDASSQATISADGRWVVFVSLASNLVANDTNDLQDIFVRDRQAGRTILVSAAVDGEAGNGMSMEPGISADGRWIAFTSSADNLVPEVDAHTGADTADTNEVTDVFVRDRLGGFTWRVSLSSDDEQSNSGSDLPGISADGRWVVFWSAADNLVPGSARGIYLRDRSTGTTRWIADGFAPTISPDGRWIGFLSSDAVSDDAGYYAMLYDQQSGEVTLIGAYAREIHGRPSSAVNFSADGEWLAFSSTFASPDSPVAGDSGEWGQQVFARDNRLGTVMLVSATPDGLPGNSYSASPSLSADGRWVAFQSLADNLVAGDANGWMDVFVWDRETGAIELVSGATGR
jgi:Tol biopolymer transport system component